MPLEKMVTTGGGSGMDGHAELLERGSGIQDMAETGDGCFMQRELLRTRCVPGL